MSRILCTDRIGCPVFVTSRAGSRVCTCTRFADVRVTTRTINVLGGDETS